MPNISELDIKKRKWWAAVEADDKMEKLFDFYLHQKLKPAHISDVCK